MGELYAEAGVKRKENVQSIAMRIGLIAFIIVSISISGMSPILVILPAVAIVSTFYFYPKISIEYEYVFCDGQLDFDKIMGKSKRKTMFKMDLEQIDIVAPSESHALDSYKQKRIKIKDCSSLNPKAKTYTIIGQAKGKDEGEIIMVIFEPSEKMVQSMKLKAPRKVVTF